MRNRHVQHTHVPNSQNHQRSELLNHDYVPKRVQKPVEQFANLRYAKQHRPLCVVLQCYVVMLRRLFAKLLERLPNRLLPYKFQPRNREVPKIEGLRPKLVLPNFRRRPKLLYRVKQLPSPFLPTELRVLLRRERILLRLHHNAPNSTKYRLYNVGLPPHKPDIVEQRGHKQLWLRVIHCVPSVHKFYVK